MPVDEGQPTQAATTDWTPPSWDDVVRDHSARVYRLAYRLAGDDDLAREFTDAADGAHRFFETPVPHRSA